MSGSLLVVKATSHEPSRKVWLVATYRAVRRAVSGVGPGNGCSNFVSQCLAGNDVGSGAILCVSFRRSPTSTLGRPESLAEPESGSEKQGTRSCFENGAGRFYLRLQAFL